MSDPHDDAIEALLRQQFDGPVVDGGFCERVMQRLPPRRQHVAWPLWTGIASGVGFCWASLVMAAPLHVGWRDWLHGDWSAAGVVTLLLITACMSLLALGWALAEPADR